MDMDTAALIQCARQRLPLFVKSLRELKIPLLLIGSQGDGMTRKDLKQEYETIALDTGAMIHMFSEGGHPSLYSNAEAAAAVIRKFLEGKN